MNYEKLLDDAAKLHMVEWNLESFRRSHPRLLKSIISAMEVAADKAKGSTLQMRTYHAQLEHDKGFVNITTMATSYKRAIDTICELEKCPESAIKKIWT